MRKILDKNATVGEKIQHYRRRRYLNSYFLAEMVGVSRHAIMDYENGVSEPSLEVLNKIAEVLEIEADKLYDNYYRFLKYPFYVKVREMREEHGLFQRELGELLGVGRRAVERWESGQNRVTREMWERFKSLGLL